MNVIEPRPNSSLRQEDDLDDFDKELETYIENEENKKSVRRAEGDQMEKGQREALGSDKERGPVEPTQSDGDDSELDDYNFTDDQRRALEELDNLKTELNGYPDEDPPEYNVKERLKTLNKELYEDPTPVEKQKDSKVGFKQNLVDLVAPPPADFSDDDDPRSPKSKAAKNAQQKQSQDKTDDKSETISGKKSNPNKDKVLIEREGKFELVSSDDVHAHDLGMPRLSHDKENQQRKTSHRQPAPPQKPRPATANGTSRRNIRTMAKQRPQSAQPVGSGPALSNFSYNSPYALSPREKELLEERKKALERQKKAGEQRKKQDNDSKEKENRDAFEYWLRKKREDRRMKITDEHQRHRDEQEDRKSENEEAFKHWLKEKSTQFRKEKLLKQREEQELHDGYYVRSRDDCDKAYKTWLKHKTAEVRQARAVERQKARVHRLATRRTRRGGQPLGRAIRDNQAFRYVDYYGYRF